MHKNSPHILNTSANLLGFCFIIITSIHIADKTESSFINDFSALISLVLSLSCLFSFSAMRTNMQSRGDFLESIAEYLFITALIGIVLLSILISFHFIG